MSAWLQGITACLAIFGLFAIGSTLWRRVRESFSRPPRMPAVSLLLIVKNKERVIEGLIRDLLSASFGAGPLPDYEVVVVDEASADQTPEILERLSRQYGCLKLVRMDRLNPAGKSAAEIGLFLCRNKYTLVCNLTGAVDAGRFRDTITYLFGEKTPAEVHQRDMG